MHKYPKWETPVFKVYVKSTLLQLSHMQVNYSLATVHKHFLYTLYFQLFYLSSIILAYYVGKCGMLGLTSRHLLAYLWNLRKKWLNKSEQTNLVNRFKRFELWNILDRNIYQDTQLQAQSQNLPDLHMTSLCSHTARNAQIINT